MKVFTVAEMVAAEKSADSANHSYATMMEMAGRGVADAICARFPVTKQHILILVGPGNNGGDGLVAARHLAQAGAGVVLYLTKVRIPAADENFSSVIKMGLQLVYAADDPALTALQHHVQQADIIIDALLGTGVTRPITGAVAGILSTVSKFRRSQPTKQSLVSLTDSSDVTEQQAQETVVVAVDCASGVNCDTGACDPLSLSAELTITFAGPKRGHFLFPAAAHCGELIVVDIGISDEHIAHIPTEVATPASIAAMLPERPLDGHKGTFGSVTVIGGSADYLGAPLLAATGALRAGAGVVSTILPTSLRMMAATRLPESSYPSVPDVDYLGLDSAETILNHLARFKNKKSALAIGPGLGSNSDALLNKLLDSDSLPPLVIDADALNYLSRQTAWWQQLPTGAILTPHPVELGRLAGRDIRNENRFDLAQTLARQWDCTLVVKGAFTLIASPGAATTVIPLATPALAVGGSGDVLAGIIAALLAQGLPPHKAAITGTWLHAAAGKQLAQTVGISGNLASEIANQIPYVTRHLRNPEKRFLSSKPLS